jgi:hypothetical protein
MSNSFTLPRSAVSAPTSVSVTTSASAPAHVLAPPAALVAVVEHPMFLVAVGAVAGYLLARLVSR